MRLHDFFDNKVPRYAILSHRWEEDEVSYQDMLGWKMLGGSGYSKIRKCCAKASSDGFEWVWIDTCCIDKKSSAELSEAINAMFRWYQASDRCYAYLSDVQSVVSEDGRLQWPCFKDSLWFTRRWTLQELLAPSHVVFLDNEWTEIGITVDMKEEIEAATGIPHRAFDFLEDFSVAQKMSWAAKRETSRVEDRAYCLLGLFGVVMPLLYGEGEQAFTRLQQEIISTSDDESIFVWSVDDLQVEGLSLATTKSEIYNRMFGINDKKTTYALAWEATCSGKLLAPRPSCFAFSGAVTRNLFFWRSPYSLTNKGLRIDTILCEDPESTAKYRYRLIPLNCKLDGEDRPLALRLSNSYNQVLWERYDWTTIQCGPESFPRRWDTGDKHEIYIDYGKRKPMLHWPAKY